MQGISDIIKGRDLSPKIEAQTAIIGEMTNFFVENGFKWMLPVMLSFVTDPLWPEPAAKHLAPPQVEIYGKKMKLMHSMILHKQLSMAMGLDRIFILSPNVRIEGADKNDGLHAYEFTQLDFEISRGTGEDAMSTIERAVSRAVNSVRESEILKSLKRELPRINGQFKSYKMSEVLDGYGSDLALSKVSDRPFWITDISREFYDREDEASPGHYRNYDLILPEGYGEVSSGGEREYRYSAIVGKLKAAGLSESSFEPYLQAAKEGLLVPSAGAGIGIERLVRYIVGAKSVEDIQPFPRVPGVAALV